MAGSASGIWDTHLPFYLSAQAMLFHLDRQGGGTFANMWLWGADHDVNTDAPIGTGAEGECCSAWPSKHGFLATSSGQAWFYGVASEHSVDWAWNMHNASNIVLIGTPQTQHSPSALNVTGQVAIPSRSSVSSPPPCIQTIIRTKGSPCRRS